MEVTRHNFKEVLPQVKQALADCQYFAWDCEMTGLFLEDKSGSFLDDMHDRYQETLSSSQSFVINQFGLSAFVWEDGAYRARTFNFYIFPRPFEGHDKRFVCQSSSLQFLAGCGFDFNKAIYDGIGYMPVTMRDARLASIDRPRQERSDVLVRKPEDVAFVQQLVARVNEWMQDGEEATLELPSVNAYQRLLTYQELRRPQFGAAEPPGFFVEKVPGESGWPALRLTRANPAEVAAFEAEERQKRIDGIHNAAGFAAVMEAIQDSGKPAVGHNLAFDLSYSLHSFAQELPGSWDEYKGLVGRWFPGGVYDTKHLSGLLPEVFEDTSLGFIHDGLLKGKLQDQLGAYLAQLAEAGPGAAAAELPAVEHAAGFERYQGCDTDAYAHEAGYDAFMTGAAFACLLRLNEAAAAGAAGQPAPGAGQQPALEAVAERCWRINISRTDMAYAALQGPDPPPDRSHVFYLHGWPENHRVHGGELARKLADSGLGQVRATIVDGGMGALIEVGDPEAVMGAADVLRERFGSWTVEEYAAYRDKRQEQREVAAAAAQAEREAAAQRRNGNKRPRVEAAAAAAPSSAVVAGAAVTGLGRSDGDGSSRCSIM